MTVSDRLRRRLGFARELGTFGVVGLVGYVVDVGMFNVLRYAGDPGVLADKPLTAKVLSVVVATIVTYLGNRYWTWRGRPRGRVRREAALFVVVNVIGLAISLVCLAVSHYLLDFTSGLADNISANGVGLVLGTSFRFWGYRTHVFPEAPASSRPASASRRSRPRPSGAAPRSARRRRSRASGAPAAPGCRTPRAAAGQRCRRPRSPGCAGRPW